MAKRPTPKTNSPKASSPAATPPTSATSTGDGNLDRIADYFWVKLFGRMYYSWDSLPKEVKNELSILNIKQLSDNVVQELFNIRHSNNRELFKKRLKELTPK